MDQTQGWRLGLRPLIVWVVPQSDQAGRATSAGWGSTDLREPAEGLGGAKGFSAREAQTYFVQNHIIP